MLYYVVDNVLLGIGRLTRGNKGVRPLGIFEVIMMLLAFGTLLVAFLRLIVEMTNKK